MEQLMLLCAAEMSADAARCLEKCESNHRLCLSLALGQCLEEVCERADPARVRLMLMCAEVCSTAAHLILCWGTLPRSVGVACADICRECAASCEQAADLQECMSACRECAEA